MKTKVNMCIVLLIILLLSSSISGCLDNSTDMKQVQSKLSEYQIEPQQVTNLINMADERGFNKEIIKDLVKNIDENRDLIIFHLNALSEDANLTISSKQFADVIANVLKNDVGAIDNTFVEDYETFERKSIQLNYVIDLLNQDFKTTFPKIEISRDFHNDLKNYESASSYIPIIEPYNKVYESSLMLPNNDKKYYTEFYKNVLLLGTDIAFIEGKLGYNLAYKSTWEINQALKLSNTRAVLGNKGYGLLLSEIHWKIRYEVGEKWDDLKQVLETENII